MPYSTQAQLRTAYDGGQKLATYKATSSLARRNGKLLDLWDISGLPAAGTMPATLAGTALSSASTGALPLRNASLDAQYLGSASLATTIAGTDFSSSGTIPTNSEVVIHVFDRLWHNGSILATTTSRQSWVSTPITRYTNGSGVSVWLRWIGSGSGTTTSNLLLEYTNQSGASASVNISVRTSVDGISSPGDLWPLGLAGGDSGIRSLDASTMATSLGSGSYGFVLMRYLGSFVSKPSSIPQSGTSFLRGLPKIEDNACLCLALQGPATAGATTLFNHTYTLTGDLVVI